MKRVTTLLSFYKRHRPLFLAEYRPLGCKKYGPLTTTAVRVDWLAVVAMG